MIDIELSDGSKISATPEHKMFTTRGVVYAGALRYDDVIVSTESCKWLANANKIGYRDAFTESFRGTSFGSGPSAGFTSARKVASKGFCTVSRFAMMQASKFRRLMGIGKTLSQATGLYHPETAVETSQANIRFRPSTVRNILDALIVDTIFQDSQKRNTCTEPFGHMPMGKSQRAITSTTSTATNQTTLLKTLSAYLPLTTARFTPKQAIGLVAKKTKSSFERLLKKLKRGTEAKKGGLGIVNMQKRQASEPVFDLTVDLHHCYFANGVLVSNSDAAGLVAVYAQTAKGEGIARKPIRRNLKGIV
jgi:hypothetical protein